MALLQKSLALGCSLWWFCVALSPTSSPRLDLSNLDGAVLDERGVKFDLDSNRVAAEPSELSRPQDQRVAFALAAEGSVSAERHAKADAWSMMRREVDSHESSERFGSEQAISEDGHPIPVYIPVPVPVPAPCPPPEEKQASTHWHVSASSRAANDPAQSPYGHLVTPQNHASERSHAPGHSSGIPGLGEHLTPNSWEGSGPLPDDVNPEDFRESNGPGLNSSSTLAHPKGKDEEAGKKVAPRKVIEVSPNNEEAKPITTPEPPEDKEEKKQEADVDAAAKREVDKSKGEAQFKKDVTQEKKEEETNEWSEKTVVFVTIVSLTACLGFTVIGLIVGAAYYYFIAGAKDSHVQFDPGSADTCAAPPPDQTARPAT